MENGHPVQNLLQTLSKPFFNSDELWLTYVESRPTFPLRFNQYRPISIYFGVAVSWYNCWSAVVALSSYYADQAMQAFYYGSWPCPVTWHLSRYAAAASCVVVAMTLPRRRARRDRPLCHRCATRAPSRGRAISWPTAGQCGRAVHGW